MRRGDGETGREEGRKALPAEATTVQYLSAATGPARHRVGFLGRRGNKHEAPEGGTCLAGSGNSTASRPAWLEQRGRGPGGQREGLEPEIPLCCSSVTLSAPE